MNIRNCKKTNSVTIAVTTQLFSCMFLTLYLCMLANLLKAEKVYEHERGIGREKAEKLYNNAVNVLSRDYDLVILISGWHANLEKNNYLEKMANQLKSEGLSVKCISLPENGTQSYIKDIAHIIKEGTTIIKEYHNEHGKYPNVCLVPHSKSAAEILAFINILGYSEKKDLSKDPVMEKSIESLIKNLGTNDIECGKVFFSYIKGAALMDPAVDVGGALDCPAYTLGRIINFVGKLPGVPGFAEGTRDVLGYTDLHRVVQKYNYGKEYLSKNNTKICLFSLTVDSGNEIVNSKTLKKIAEGLNASFAPLIKNSKIEEAYFNNGYIGKEKKVILEKAPSSQGTHSFCTEEVIKTIKLIVAPPKIENISNEIGGVMLNGVATVRNGKNAQVEFASGNFSLVVDGKNARLDPKVFRKFVTALWAVYYGSEDPGISIDPIAPGIDKHLVRYIGKVVNTDLGRVMREADYLMKKWSVGTERPDIPGFKNPDDISGRNGYKYVNVWSRFWFVPENMTFNRSGDMLLFAGGRMTLKTEFMLKHNKNRDADPACEEFAQFFTKHYNEIAEKYPVYKELFEYAKLVALAKYLKEQGVPLYWFLMANKDLVITEDSPGTVDALAKGSDYFKNINIEGGVKTVPEKYHYVIDNEAINAINEALAKLSERPSSGTSVGRAKNMWQHSAEPFSFEHHKKNYSVLPQYSLTSGKDKRDIRYQTDLALRQNKEPGLEIVRYYNPKKTGDGEFGKGWHLLIPYRIKPTDEEKREFLNAIIPKRMTLENLITGDEEVLTFSENRYSIAGYVPEKLNSSQVVGLFLVSDASYRLADKLGNEFWFDQAGHLTDMFFSRDHHLKIEYLNGFTDAFEQSPYEIQPADDDRVEFLNVSLPKRMKITDLIHKSTEVLIFSDKGKIAGYVPENEEKSKYKILALMSDASFRLLDRENNEIVFNPKGEFEKLAVPTDRRMIKSISMGEQKVSFKYTIDNSGKILIASAQLSNDKGSGKPIYTVKYQYDTEGRLSSVKGPANQSYE